VIRRYIESVLHREEQKVYIFWIITIRDKGMKAYLINKNLCFYYWLRKRIGKKNALWLAKDIEKVILLF